MSKMLKIVPNQPMTIPEELKCYEFGYKRIVAKGIGDSFFARGLWEMK